jgi:hypothetical protein
MADKEFDYKDHKLIARQYANGWQLEIRSKGGQANRTMMFQELEDALVEAKKIVDRMRRISN